jgi:hypothetical protein
MPVTRNLPLPHSRLQTLLVICDRCGHADHFLIRDGDESFSSHARLHTRRNKDACVESVIDLRLALLPTLASSWAGTIKNRLRT